MKNLVGLTKATGGIRDCPGNGSLLRGRQSARGRRPRLTVGGRKVVWLPSMIQYSPSTISWRATGRLACCTDVSMTIVCWSVKGGSGTTVTAVSLARLLADRHKEGALLVDTQGDGLVVLGHDAPVERGLRTWLASPADVGTSALDLLAIDVGRNLKVLPEGNVPDRSPVPERWQAMGSYLEDLSVPVVVDLGTLSTAGRSGRRSLLVAAHTSLLVVRPCYLAIRRAVDFPVRPTGVVVVREADRSLPQPTFPRHSVSRSSRRLRSIRASPASSTPDS